MAERHHSLNFRNHWVAAGNEERVAAVCAYNHDVLATIEHRGSVAVEFLSCGNVEGQVRTQTTIIPREFTFRQSQVWQVRSGREAEGDFLCRRTSVGHEHR